MLSTPRQRSSTRQKNRWTYTTRQNWNTPPPTASSPTVDQATKFFMDNWYQGEKPCRQEGTSFSLKKFHDAMLDNGMPPIRLLRERLLKDRSTWDQIL